MAELEETELSWGEAQAAAIERTLWRNIAPCPTGDEEATKLSKLKDEHLRKGLCPDAVLPCYCSKVQRGAIQARADQWSEGDQLHHT